MCITKVCPEFSEVLLNLDLDTGDSQKNIQERRFL